MTGESGISNTGNILGDPKRSLIVMVVPIAIGMLVQALNNLVDAIWVSSLGTGALAATGVVFPFFFILVGIGNGLGVGASQAIARRIGVGDRAGASRVAAQVVLAGEGAMFPDGKPVKAIFCLTTVDRYSHWGTLYAIYTAYSDQQRFAKELDEWRACAEPVEA